MSQSDLTGPAGAAGGFAFYFYGTRIIINNPWTNIDWAFYEGPLTNRGGPKQALADVLRQGGIGFNRRTHLVAPGSTLGVPPKRSGSVPRPASIGLKTLRANIPELASPKGRRDMTSGEHGR